MVKSEKYPEAACLSQEELERNINLFKKIFAMAKERGIETYIWNWNIFVTEQFAEAHNIPDKGGNGWPNKDRDNPLVNDYTKEYVKALVKTYPDLTGVAACPGERMPAQGVRHHWRNRDISWRNAEWIEKTYFAGIKESGRIVPFMLEAWYTRPDVVDEVLAKDYPAEFTCFKYFNGEHTYALPSPHFYDEEWLTLENRRYKLIWELRQADIFVFRWGDIGFVREMMLNCKPHSVGIMHLDDMCFRPDREHSEESKAHVDWQYVFEKRWFHMMLMGRLAYDPNIPESLWIKHFTKRFGEEAGKNIYRALVVSSKILPTVTSFHWNYMDGDWQPEYCTGNWNTGENYRESFLGWRWEGSKFHSVLEWIFNHTIESTWLNIPQYVDRVLKGRPINKWEKTPLNVAEDLDSYGRETIELLEKASMEKVSREFECTYLDLKALALLGEYYAEKTRGATELMFFLRTGDENHQAAAIRHLKDAEKLWKKLVDVASKHYANPAHFSTQAGVRWDKHAKDVERDIEIAYQLGYSQPMIH